MQPRRRGSPAARAPHRLPLPPPGPAPGAPLPPGPGLPLAGLRLPHAKGGLGRAAGSGPDLADRERQRGTRGGAGARADGAGAAGAVWSGRRRGCTQHTPGRGGFKSGGLVRRKGAKGLGRGALMVGCSRRSPPTHPTRAAGAKRVGTTEGRTGCAQKTPPNQ